MADRWHPVDESPKYGGIFIVWIEPPSGSYWQYDFAVFTTISRMWIDENGDPYPHKITHWRPSPGKPE